MQINAHRDTERGKQTQREMEIDNGRQTENKSP